MMTSFRSIRIATALALASSLTGFAFGADTTNQPTLTLEGGKRAVAAAIEYARSHGAPGGSIAVVDAGGSIVYVERLEGSFPASADVSIGKARTAVRFRRPSEVFAALSATPAGGFLPTLSDPPPVASPGGFPLVENGKIIGAIGCSGATGPQDAVACKAGAETIK